MSEEHFESYLGRGKQELFHRVINLSAEDLDWDTLSVEVPILPRGWFELSRLSAEDRIEFTRAFWISQLPFISAKCNEGLESFFDQLETIEIYATQLQAGQPFDAYMIYVLQNEAGFFQGGPGALEEDLSMLKKQFAHIEFPQDYLAFLKIHNGFSKYTDTGLIKIKDMARNYSRFQEILQHEELIRPDGHVIEPKSLIPFYESFGLHCYQCYYADWYVENEMGNVYFSEHDRTISNFLETTRLEENLAFSTFLSWLIFYLEDIWHV